ncbi:MAG: hypothetical protein K6B12_03860 [Clostridiales bacterium]|nr:hypothetical protein [Clostridiales bacterium]
MEKKKTPVSTVIFYIIGIILLIVSLFMLWTAVNYTKTYLASYDATFKDMWSNSMQYIITQFVPYLGMGVICLGLGRAIYGSANAKAVQPASAAGAAEAKDDAAEEAQKDGEGAAEAAADAEDAAKAAEPAETVSEAAGAAAGAAIGAGAVSAGQMEELFRRIDMNREVLSIKIEEKEKRDSFRIKELERKVDGFLDDVKYINEPLEELVYKQAAGIEDEEITPAEATAAEPAAAVEPVATAAEPGTLQKAAGIIPQIFRMARNMAMPAVPEATFEPAKTEAAPAPAAAGAVPQIFTVSRRMTAPACPAVEAAAAEEPAPAAAGAVPQIFTVSRRMTAPACPAVEK